MKFNIDHNALDCERTCATKSNFYCSVSDVQRSLSR